VEAEMLQTHEIEIAVLVVQEPRVAGTGLVQAASAPSASGWRRRTGRLLDVVDVAVALPALISATAVWGVLSATVLH
jgi:hypothetical protein